MIRVIGASGTVGSEVIRQLELAKAPFRAGYFSKEKAEAAREFDSSSSPFHTLIINNL